MGKPYSLDLRERVVTAIKSGMSTGEAAKCFAVSKAAAGEWARRERRTGSVAPAKQGKPRGLKLDAHADFILGLIEKKRDITLDEMVERLAGERSVKIVRSAVWTFLNRREQTHKKRPRTPQSKSALM
jgi:transposase